MTMCSCDYCRDMWKPFPYRVIWTDPVYSWQFLAAVTEGVCW